MKAIQEQLKDWERFYREVFGMEKDFSSLRIPESRDGFDWLIVVAQGLNIEKILKKVQEKMRTSLIEYTDPEELASILPLFYEMKSVRNADRDYAVWVRDSKETGEELDKLSAYDLKEKGIPCITFPERLILELKFNWETGDHLDKKSSTLCAGSFEEENDAVPSVSWKAGSWKTRAMLYINAFCYTGDRSGTTVYTWAREVIV